MKIILPVKDASLFENIPQIDVGIKEVRVECNSFLKVMYGQPYLTLSVEDTAKVAPGNSKVGASLDSFQVAGLVSIIREVEEREGVNKTKDFST